MKLADLRTPGLDDSFYPIVAEGTENVTVYVQDMEWQEITAIFEGQHAKEEAKAACIEHILERYGEYDGWDGSNSETGEYEGIDRDADGVPV